MAQSSKKKSLKADERLVEVYGNTYIEALKTNNPFLIKRLNFYLDNAYQVVEDAPRKGNTYPSVIISDLEKINILQLEKDQNLTRDYHKPVIYSIANTNKILVYYSEKEFSQKLREHLTQP